MGLQRTRSARLSKSNQIKLFRELTEMELSETIVRCSFCLRSNREVAHLIHAANEDYVHVYICEDCARDCIQIIEEDKRDFESKN
jgi:HEPN domain-containing protein